MGSKTTPGGTSTNALGDPPRDVGFPSSSALRATAPSRPLQNHQASVIALTDATGAATATLAYDEYGRPRAGNLGRFQYTGQTMLPDFGLQHYKARAYHAALGRFVQTDPVGFDAGLSLYAYTRRLT